MPKRRKSRKPKMGKSKVRPVLRLVTANNHDSLSERKYFKDLNALIDRIYEEAAVQHQWTWNQLAAHAELTYSTVLKLGERKTLYPRFQTVYKLAKAVGWEVALNPTKQTQGKGRHLKVSVG